MQNNSEEDWKKCSTAACGISQTFVYFDTTCKSF